MRKIAFALALLFGIINGAQAQNKSAAVSTDKPLSIEAVAQHETDKLDKVVRLTPEQKRQIQDLNLSLAKRVELVESSKIENKEVVMRQIEDNRVKMYLQVLTDNQAALYKKSLVMDRK